MQKTLQRATAHLSIPRFSPSFPLSAIRSWQAGRAVSLYICHAVIYVLLTTACRSLFCYKAEDHQLFWSSSCCASGNNCCCQCMHPAAAVRQLVHPFLPISSFPPEPFFSSSPLVRSSTSIPAISSTARVKGSVRWPRLVTTVLALPAEVLQKQWLLCTSIPKSTCCVLCGVCAGHS
jgi:hypothetical protein